MCINSVKAYAAKQAGSDANLHVAQSLNGSSVVFSHFFFLMTSLLETHNITQAVVSVGSEMLQLNNSIFCFFFKCSGVKM